MKWGLRAVFVAIAVLAGVAQAMRARAERPAPRAHATDMRPAFNPCSGGEPQRRLS